MCGARLTAHAGRNCGRTAAIARAGVWMAARIRIKLAEDGKPPRRAPELKFRRKMARGSCRRVIDECSMVDAAPPKGFGRRRRRRLSSSRQSHLSVRKIRHH
jgi:hypothetical protein